MQYNTFYIPIGDEGEAQERLNAFLRGHRVTQVERHSFEGGWGFCVEWLDGTSPSSSGTRWKTPRVDYREILEAEAFSRFARLRERRKAIAAEDGIAPYMVLTDAQMAEVAKLESLTEAEFKRIPGVGESKANKYFARLKETDGLESDREESGK